VTGSTRAGSSRVGASPRQQRTVSGAGGSEALDARDGSTGSETRQSQRGKRNSTTKRGDEPKAKERLYAGSTIRHSSSRLLRRLSTARAVHNHHRVGMPPSAPMPLCAVPRPRHEVQRAPTGRPAKLRAVFCPIVACASPHLKGSHHHLDAKAAGAPHIVSEGEAILRENVPRGRRRRTAALGP
jgi:hypothetical protein